MRRKLVWKVLTIRRTSASGDSNTAGSLIGVPAALALLLALSPVGPLPAGSMALGPTQGHIARAEAAPSTLTTGGPSSALSTGGSAGSSEPAGLSVTANLGTSAGTSVTSTVVRSSVTTFSRDAEPTPPALTVFGVVSTVSLRPAAATATPTPTATATATASPTPTASPTVTPTITPNPYASDTLTDVSKVAGWQSIDWPAYVPAAVATPVPGVKGTGQFILPVSGFISTQYSATHLAIDIAGPTGSAVLAADTGTIVFAGLDYGGLGYAVEIDHGDGYISAYGHNSALKVQTGQIVRRGDLIALRGSTGHSTGPHVHFAIHKNGQAVDPFNVLIGGNPPAPVPQVLVPNLVGDTAANAAAALKGLTLQLAVDPPQPSADVPAGKLAVQQPAAGSLADMNTAVHVVLSSGTPTPTVTATPDGSPTPTLSPPASGTPTIAATATADGTAAPTVTAPAVPTTVATSADKVIANAATATVTASATAPVRTAVPATATAAVSPPATATRQSSTATATAVADTPTPTTTPVAHVPPTATATGHSAVGH